MKTIAVLDADFDTTWLGTSSRLGERVGDETVLGMTIRRLQRCERLQGIHVLVPPDQHGRATGLLRGTSAVVQSHDAGAAPFARLIRVARKWSLDGWRGGIGGASVIDEYVHPRPMAATAQQTSADAVLCASPASPLIDPCLTDAMIEHFATVSEDMRMTFALAPPGLTGTLCQTGLLAELAAKNIPPGWTMSYKPDAPSIDLTARKCCFQAPAAVRHASGRMIADTRASLDRVRRCLTAQPDPDAETVGRWLMEHETERVPELPREVEIELTTDDQLASTALRPRPPRGFDSRGPIDVEVVRRLATELAVDDDARAVLGGFGEPLLHPDLDGILGVLRDAGVCGIALRTNGIALTDRVIDGLVRHQVDVVAVTLDAASPETYAALHHRSAYEDVVRNIERLVAARDGKPVDGPPRPPAVTPLIVPEMIKCRETLREMDAFFDGWLRKVGWALVVGYNHYGHRLEDRAVVDMTPPDREACRRVRTRCLVTAAADVLVCDQDFAAERPAGNLRDASLSDIWRGAAMTRVRQAHARGAYRGVHLCGPCAEWHRP